MKNKRNFQKNNAITLIALVVTIVVLLILAGVSIAMLTGENGIIKQAQNAKQKTEQAKLEELVKLAINGLLAENKGNKNLITPKMIADRINKDENRTDVKAEGTTFPTNIIFEEEGRKVEVDINLSIKEGTGDVPGTESTTIFSDVDGMSEEELINEANQNIDLFEYQIIDAAEVGATELGTLPTKTAKITQIKEIYCNHIASKEPLYDENNNEYADTNYEIIYKGEKISDTLVVPYQVEIDGEMYKITEASLGVKYEENGHSGYSALPRVETIIYPNTIEEISGPEYMSYDGQTIVNLQVKNIILPQNLKTIGENAFFCCEDLINIIIPDTVTRIGEQAFYRCTELTNIAIPNSVITIGANAFYDTKWYKNQPDGEVYINNILYKYKGTMPNNTSIILKSKTTSISGEAFFECSGLTNITIPESVKDIGSYAFYKCTGLTSVTIPEGVKNIGSNAFRQCRELTSITIPSSITKIEDRTFFECSGLTTIIIPEGVISIGEEAFSWSENLTNVTMPESVTSIGMAAFCGCTGLTSIEIPEGITSIERKTFSDCTGLTSIKIPDGVTSIGGYAFFNCTSLTSVIIPENVADINAYVFQDCTNLSTVYFTQSTVPEFGYYCFYKISNPKTIFYFKNIDVFNAFDTSCYNSSYGEKSPDFNW